LEKPHELEQFEPRLEKLERRKRWEVGRWPLVARRRHAKGVGEEFSEIRSGRVGAAWLMHDLAVRPDTH
jgi:hypothetical protein